MLALSALLALLLGALAFWLYQNMEYVRETQTGPPRGPAAYDPLYAAQRTVESYGLPVVSRSFLQSDPRQLLKPGDTLIYYGETFALSTKQVVALDKWMAAGGHLIVHIPEVDSRDTGLLLRQFKIKLASGGGGALCPALLLGENEKPYKPPICDSARFTTEAAGVTRAIGDTRHGLVMARIKVGDGFLSVLSSLKFMNNENLDDAGNARFMLRVLAPNLGRGRIVMIYSMSMAPWPMLLLQYGWPCLVALAILLLAWLVAVSRRFGPLRSAVPAPRRALLEHVRAGAELVCRSGAATVLCRAVRDDVLDRLRRRHAAAAASTANERIRYLNTVSGIDEERIRAAFAAAPAKPDREFQESVLVLLAIRKHL